MATVEVAFLSPVDRASALDNAYPDAVQVITSSASNQISTAEAAATGQTVIVTSIGGAVKISIGASPNATSDAKVRFIPDGQSRAFGGVQIGHKVAVADA